MNNSLKLSGNNYLNIKRLVCRSKGASVGDLVVLRNNKNKAGTTVTSILNNRIEESIPVLSSKIENKLKNPILLVEDTQDFIEKYILYKRKEFSTKWIYVTGSVGKTTTSYMLHRALLMFSSSYYARQGNIYSAICSSACLLDEENTEYAVFEVAQGALPEASAKFHPDVSLFISLSPAHMERHKDLKSLAICKAAVFEGGKKGDKAIINRDIDYYDLVEKVAIDNHRDIITYGKHEDADFRIIEYNISGFKFQYLNDYYTIKQDVIGEHISLNLLSIISTLHVLGYPWKSFLEKISEIVFIPKGRGNIVNYSLPKNKGSSLFIDQSYNSTPLSMFSALNMLNDYPAISRKVVVLSDMLELGVNSENYHIDVVNYLSNFDFDLVITCGEIINKKINDKYNKEYISFVNVNDAFSYLIENLMDGDVVMVKGSNGTGLNKELSKYLY